MSAVEVTLAASVPLSTQQRDRLGVFADALISGGAGMPSATGAEVHSQWIDRVFAARPDMEATVREVLGREGEPAGILASLRAGEPDRFSSFAFAVAGAYLINPRIRRDLGYPGPVPVKNPALPDEAEAYLEGGILDVVIARGPIFRPTPDL